MNLSNVNWNESWQQIIHNQYVLGLATGLGIALIFWFLGIRRRSELRREVHKLREYLNTQMDITARGSDGLKKEAELLRQQNENLRITIKEWQQRPGRNELRSLMIYDKAVRILNQTAPGFSPVWEKAIREAEDDVIASESGVTALIRRTFRPFSLERGDRLPARPVTPELEGGKVEKVAAVDDDLHGRNVSH